MKNQSTRNELSHSENIWIDMWQVLFIVNIDENIILSFLGQKTAPYPDVISYRLNIMGAQTNSPKLWARCCVVSLQKRDYLQVGTVLLWTAKGCLISYHISFTKALKIAILAVNKYRYYFALFDQLFLYYITEI